MVEEAPAHQRVEADVTGQPGREPTSDAEPAPGYMGTGAVLGLAPRPARNELVEGANRASMVMSDVRRCEFLG